MQAKLYKQVYRMEEGERWAEIIFTEGKFTTCRYEVSKFNSYNLEDWEFLGKVAREIKRLVLRRARR